MRTKPDKLTQKYFRIRRNKTAANMGLWQAGADGSN